MYHQDDGGQVGGRRQVSDGPGLTASGASSLLDRTEQEWRELFGRKRSNAVRVLPACPRH